VIVICPSCGTPYSHAREECSPARSATCSRCTFTFPIPSGRSYRVGDGISASDATKPVDAARSALPKAARPVPDLAIGMDDPALTASLGRTALKQEAGQPRKAMTYWVVASEAGAGDASREAQAREAEALEAEHERAEAPRPSELSFEPAPPVRSRAALAIAAGAGGGLVCGAAAAALAEMSFGIGAAVGCVSGVALAGGLLRWNKRRP
jgi:hypothetical protein